MQNRPPVDLTGFTYEPRTRSYAQVRRDGDGRTYGPAPVGALLDSSRLTPFRASDYPSDSPEVLRRIPQAICNPGDYGDMVVKPIVYAAAGDVLALERTQHTRIYLVIQNNLVGNQIAVTFDNVATLLNGIIIPPGGNLLFDARVPQNDLHVFANGAGTVIVGYINADIARAPG